MTAKNKGTEFKTVERIARAMCVADGNNPEQDIYQLPVMELMKTPRGELSVVSGPTMKAWVAYVDGATVACNTLAMVNK